MRLTFIDLHYDISKKHRPLMIEISKMIIIMLIIIITMTLRNAKLTLKAK